MQIAKNVTYPHRKAVLMLIGLLLMFVAGQSFALAQNASSASTHEQELKVSDLLKLPGTVIAEGSNQTPRGQLKVARYRVEQVTLPQPASVEVAGKRTEVDTAFRVSIIGGPFPVRALPPVVWIDDTAVGYGVESEDLDEITVVTFDRSLIKDGASIYLSYGDKEQKEGRTELPEKLSLGSVKGDRQ